MPVSRRWQRGLDRKAASVVQEPLAEPRLVGRWAIASTGRLGLITGRRLGNDSVQRWIGIGIDSKEWASRDPRILVDADAEVLNSLADVLEIRLTQSVQKACLHTDERVIDAKGTDSDTEVWTYFCPECQQVRDDEVVGSKARALAKEWDETEPTSPCLGGCGKMIKSGGQCYDCFLKSGEVPEGG